jgi:hypothetical protein
MGKSSSARGAVSTAEWFYFAHITCVMRARNLYWIVAMEKEQKKLQKHSEYNGYDVDGDGVVSDEELATVKAIHEATAQEQKADAQRHMAWLAMASIIIFTIVLFLPVVPDARVKLLGDLSSLFYVAMAGVVGAYMGMTAYMSTNGKK